MINSKDFDNTESFDNSMINQTQFSFEEPMRETGQPTFETKKNDLQEEANKENKKSKKIPIFALFAGIGFLLVMLGLAAVFMRPRQTTQNITNQTETPTGNKPVVRDPILTRLDNASAELKNADPSKQDLVFPPVNMDIRLDKEK